MDGKTRSPRETKHTPGPCPFLYPSFMSAIDQCIATADDAFCDLAGRWADGAERAEYIAAIKRGDGVASSGYAAARAALEKARGE